MNTSEGLLRLAKVVRWIGFGLATFLTLGAIVIAFFGESLSDRWQVVGISLIGAVFWAVVGWALAWIIEGFAKPKPTQ
jgi:hypothetical protein